MKTDSWAAITEAFAKQPAGDFHPGVHESAESVLDHCANPNITDEAIAPYLLAMVSRITPQGKSVLVEPYLNAVWHSNQYFAVTASEVSPRLLQELVPRLRRSLLVALPKTTALRAPGS